MCGVQKVHLIHIILHSLTFCYSCLIIAGRKGSALPQVKKSNGEAPPPKQRRLNHGTYQKNA